MTRTNAVVLFLVILVMALIIFATQFVTDTRVVEEQCRFRLFRVGGAVNLWLDDSGQRAFPEIENPPPHEQFIPHRPKSASVVLEQFLGGNLALSKRPDKSEEQHLANVREVELTTCPVTRLEFWYNYSDLRSLDPKDLMSGNQKNLWIFRCQSKIDGGLPHREHGKDGVHAVYASGVSRTITFEEAELMQQELDDLIAAFKRAPSDQALKDQIADMRGWLESVQRKKSGADATVSKIEMTVKFLPEN
jgi:hypothetical protein